MYTRVWYQVGDQVRYDGQIRTVMQIVVNFAGGQWLWLEDEGPLAADTVRPL